MKWGGGPVQDFVPESPATWYQHLKGYHQERKIQTIHTEGSSVKLEMSKYMYRTCNLNFMLLL